MQNGLQADVPMPQSIDTLISEPIGVLLVHERMLESFIVARDNFLRPGGDIYPTTGCIKLAPFCDINLWAETMQKAKWWQQPDFYGIDLNPFFDTAVKECFSMPVVGPFSPHILLTSDSNYSSFSIDFRTVELKELLELNIPCHFVAGYTGLMHGIAGWFDCDFIPTTINNPSFCENGNIDGGTEDIIAEPQLNSGLTATTNDVAAQIIDESDKLTLSTHPSQPVTHWQQVRFLLAEPLAVNRGDIIMGRFVLKANRMRSYSITGEFWLTAADGSSLRPGTYRRSSWELQDQLYNYTSLRPDVSHDWFGMYNDNTH